jgi:hypothetical protein
MPSHKQALLATLLFLAPLWVQASHLEEFHTTRGTYLIDWRGEFTPSQQDKLRTWLNDIGATVSLLHGTWPRQRIRIAFKPNSYPAPLPFARVLRNNPEGVLFYVNPERPLNEFITDWTAYHELSHLFIPYPGKADVWFSEGLASYYQNVLQVRAGLLTPEQAIARFDAAFTRGSNDADHADLTLGELSANMRNQHAYMRVYWSGALYFLEADLQLRASDNASSLDDVLRDYGACCLIGGSEVPGRQIAAEFDRIAGKTLFVPLYDRYEASRALPGWQSLLESLRSAEILTVPEPDNPVKKKLMR